MICQLCATNPINTELQTLSKRPVCVPCATAIAEALPLLKTQPCRRQTICMRLHEYGIRISPADKRLFELIEYGVTDEQIRGACDIAKESTGGTNFGYVLAILRNERQRKAPVVGSGVNEQSSGGKAAAPVVKEDWERLGFVSQADYEKWQWSFDQAYRKGSRISEAESRRLWQAEAV